MPEKHGFLLFQGPLRKVDVNDRDGVVDKLTVVWRVFGKHHCAILGAIEEELMSQREWFCRKMLTGVF